MSNNGTANNIDVAITYGWNRVAYNVLRALSHSGVTVAVGDPSFLAMAKRSKYCRRTFTYPSFHNNPLKFIENLTSIFEKISPQVYLPMHEETFIVAKYIKRFESLGVKVPIHDFETLQMIHRKDSVCDVAEKLDIPVPKTYKPRDQQDLKEIWSELPNPKMAVIKTINSNSSKGVHYAKSYDEFIRIYENLLETNIFDKEEYPIIQEYVCGRGYGVSMLFNKGELRARFTHRRLREKIASGGTSTVRGSTKNAVLEEFSERLLSSLNWHGIAMVEYKWDETKKVGWLMEVNPRFWGSLGLAIKAGVNFPYLLYKMAIDGDVDPVLDYHEDVIVKWILGDALAYIDFLRGRSKLKNVINGYKGKVSGYDDLYFDDMKPFIFQCAGYLYRFIKSRSTNPTEGALMDVTNL